MNKVYFSKNNIGELFDQLKADLISPVGIKTHFGERGNVTFINPKHVEAVYNKVIAEKAEAKLIECNVMYKGSRTNRSDHLETAQEHGFTFAPIEICDGEDGSEEWRIPVELKHFKEVIVGKGLKDFKSLIVVSHFKGHGGNGFGGALKNLGMGLGSRAGKLAMHAAFDLRINEDKCIACGICAAGCPANAITVDDFAKIDRKKCIGCAMCIANCPQDAVEIPWGGSSSEELQEKIVEYCAGILQEIPGVAYFNVLENITSECDCWGNTMKPLIPDIGILASTDPVALDQASFDLVNKAAGVDLFKKEHHIDATAQLKYAEELGLGKRKYDLVNID